MGESVDFIKDRATKSISAARQLAGTWDWQEKTPDDMQAALNGIIGDSTADPPLPGQEEIVAEKEQDMLKARGAWDNKLDQLHRWTMQGVGMVKNRFRNDSKTLEQLDPLTARGTSRAETLDEALAWESAWEAVDPTWAPLPANTLDAFKQLRSNCNGDLKKKYSDAQAAWSKEAKKLASMAAALEDMNEAWYLDATKVFAPGTTEGDMIRGTVPTTYNPPPAKPATKTAPVKPNV